MWRVIAAVLLLITSFVAVAYNANNYRISDNIYEHIIEATPHEPILRNQLLVFSKALERYIHANTPREAYKHYLVTEAVFYCVVSYGYPRSYVVSLLNEVSMQQLDTPKRQLDAARAESLLEESTMPYLMLHSNPRDYCQYTS
ncbi:hypothetical protein LRP52_29210 [Photobacterium sp. ZSDE20]|uniref:Uncharacterized protein n=1 Tax=Photobacterium pectinilyticum TaxID=2906793 RepID=A0ABT1N6V2_9GAMM|nr:hypothetical protein [Photobacterium sp. ZSDE20]MCQ1060272.1 hypothetical protein [Photobacterium sp. ZSDE20]MDD1826259.1 hypothetical protein [Photobacterium sp. ZSDE20]